MPGLLIGTLCLLGLFLLLAGSRRRWRHHHRMAYGRCGHHGRGRRAEGRYESCEREARYERGREEGHGTWLSGLDASSLGSVIDLDDEQRGVIDAASKDTRRAIDALWVSLSESRAELARAIKGEQIDDDRIAAVFEWHDEALGRARREVSTAWKAALLSLSQDQRSKIADLLAGSGRTGFV